MKHTAMYMGIVEQPPATVMECLWKPSSAPYIVQLLMTFVMSSPFHFSYEIQLEKEVQRKGLGKFMMQVLELLAFQ